MESIIRTRTRVPAGTVIFLELWVAKRAGDFGGPVNAVTRAMAPELGSPTVITISKVAGQRDRFRTEKSPFLKFNEPVPSRLLRSD
jgi:hypothetical protein